MAMNRKHSRRAFTILEVVMASAIFFMVGFAILGVVSQGLVGARSLQRKAPDAGLLAAEMMFTNSFEEGIESGDFETMYPGIYSGYTWTREIREAYSNGLFQVTFQINGPRKNFRDDASQSLSTIYVWCPTCPQGSITKGMGR